MNEAISAPSSDAPAEVSRVRLFGKIIIFFSALFFFTMLKVPDVKVKGHLNSLIFKNAALQGYSLSAADSELSLGLGLSYALKDVTLGLKQSDTPPIRLDSIEISPSILSLLTGKVGATLQINKGKGSIEGFAGVRGSSLDIALDITEMNFSDSPLALFLGNIQIESVMSGKIRLNGPMDQPNQLSGDIDLKLGKIKLDAQTISSFPVPATKTSGGLFKIKIQNGVASIQNASLGTIGKKEDDIALKATGDITLKPRIESSTLKIDLQLGFAPQFLDQSELFLIQSFISAAKQSDSTYRYNLTGPLYSPSMDPVKL